MTTTTLTLLPHHSPHVERLGFELRSEYVERCHLPLLGPSGTAVLRLAPLLWRDVEPITLPTSDLARMVGTKHNGGRHSPLSHTLDRPVRLGYAEWLGEGELGIYGTVPPLSRKQLEKVPDDVAQLHHHYLDAHLDRLASRA